MCGGHLWATNGHKFPSLMPLHIQGVNVLFRIKFRTVCLKADVVFIALHPPAVAKPPPKVTRKSSVLYCSMDKKPASQKKSGANFLPTPAPKAKPEPVADKGFFDRLIKRASRPTGKPDGKTSASQSDGD